MGWGGDGLRGNFYKNFVQKDELNVCVGGVRGGGREIELE